jgi:hypothetical protein
LREDAGGDVEIDDAGFDGDAGVGEIDFEDAVHTGEADDNAVFYGERAAGEAGASAACYEGEAFAMAEAEDGLDLFGGGGKQDGAGTDDGAKFVEETAVHVGCGKDSTVAGEREGGDQT